MALAVSQPTVKWAASVSSGNNITSASFTPTANSLLVLEYIVRDGGSTNVSNSSASGGSLTWTRQCKIGFVDNAKDVYAAIFTAPVGASPSAMTVSVQNTNGNGGTISNAAAVFQVTGQDAVTPVGATGTGAVTTAGGNITAYTSTANNSRCLWVLSDDNGRGNPSSTDSTIDFVSLLQDISYGYKNADTPTSGSAVTFNETVAANQLANYACVEIKPSGGGGGGGKILSEGGILTSGILTGGALIGGSCGRTRSTVFFPDFRKTRKLAFL